MAAQVQNRTILRRADGRLTVEAQPHGDGRALRLRANRKPRNPGPPTQQPLAIPEPGGARLCPSPARARAPSILAQSEPSLAGGARARASTLRPATRPLLPVGDVAGCRGSPCRWAAVS